MFYLCTLYAKAIWDKCEVSCPLTAVETVRTEAGGDNERIENLKEMSICGLGLTHTHT